MSTYYEKICQENSQLSSINVPPSIAKFSDQIIDQLELEDGEDRFGLAIMLILAITSITITIARWIWDCRHQTEDEMMRAIRHPSIYQTVQVRRIVRKNLSAKDYTRYGKRITNAIFRAAEAGSDSDLAYVIGEAGKAPQQSILPSSVDSPSAYL